MAAVHSRLPFEFRADWLGATTSAARGSVRFAMGVHIPAELTARRQLTVTWRPIAPTLAGEQKLTVGFTLTAA